MENRFIQKLKNINDPKAFELMYDSLISLTPKEENFCYNYIITNGNRSEAYKLSFNCKNSNPNTIKEAASRLFKKEKIRKRIAELRDEINKEFKYTAYESFKNLEFAQKLALGLEADDDIDGDSILRIFKTKKLPKADISNFISAEEKKAKITGILNPSDGNTSISFKDIILNTEAEIEPVNQNTGQNTGQNTNQNPEAQEVKS
jgi:hypothetical protein